MEAAASLGVELEEWAVAHHALSGLCLRRAALDADEGKWLLRAFRAATHAHFGFASFGEYVERLFGLGRRATEEKLRVATALEGLPELEQALRSGSLNWSSVREVTRVAASETEREWIAAARGRTAREVERLVSGLAPGDRPKDPRRPERVRHVLRFEVGAETLATFREAMRLLQKQSEHRLNDDEALLSMAREVLGGPRDAGRASYQVVVTQCEDCGRGFQHANGELVELDPAIVEMCRCDTQNVMIAPARAAVGLDEIDAHVSAEGVAEMNAHRCTADQVAESNAFVCAGDGVAMKNHPCTADQAAESNAFVCTADQIAEKNAHVCAADQIAEKNAHVCAGEQAEAKDAHPSSAGGLAAVRRPLEPRSKPREGTRRAGGCAGSKRSRATQDTPPAVRREVFFRDRGFRKGGPRRDRASSGRCSRGVVGGVAVEIGGGSRERLRTVSNRLVSAERELGRTRDAALPLRNADADYQLFTSDSLSLQVLVFHWLAPLWSEVDSPS